MNLHINSIIKFIYHLIYIFLIFYFTTDFKLMIMNIIIKIYDYLLFLDQCFSF